MPTKNVIQMFSSNDARTYVELREGNEIRQILTEHRQPYTAILVFNKLNNPEVLKLSFIDSLKRRTIWTIEVREQKDIRPLGRKLIRRKRIKSLKSDSLEFKEWKRRFSSSPRTRASVRKDFMVVNDSNVSSEGVKVAALSVKDWLCWCKDGKIAGHCFVSALRCAADNLCDAWDCVESGEWTDDCRQSLEQAEICLAQATF